MRKMYAFFYYMTNYELMARLLYRIGISFPNIKMSKTYKFEFENFRSDKTVLWKTYVTYEGNAKERKSTYRKHIFFIRNCARTSRPVPFLLINYELMVRLQYGIGTFFPDIKRTQNISFPYSIFYRDEFWRTSLCKLSAAGVSISQLSVALILTELFYLEYLNLQSIILNGK